MKTSTYYFVKRFTECTDSHLNKFLRTVCNVIIPYCPRVYEAFQFVESQSIEVVVDIWHRIANLKYLWRVVFDRISFRACILDMYFKHRLQLFTVKEGYGDIVEICWRSTVNETFVASK